MRQVMSRLWREESGQDLTEYGLLMVLVALGAIAAMNGLASAIAKAYNSAANNLTNTTT